MGSEALPPRLVEALAKPEAYPDDPSAKDGVEEIQTHLSHLFLTERRVVKLRKPVSLSFVDFSGRARRIEDCHDEVTLNRRLAPDVYLGVARVDPRSGSFEVRDEWESSRESEQTHPECERVVVMRRLETGRDALSLLEQGALDTDHLDAVAVKLARFHERVALGIPAPWSSKEWSEHCLRPVAATLESLAEHALDDEMAAATAELSAAVHRRFEALRERLEVRRRKGRAVEGHGDVHLQHVWFEREAAEPVLIDCVEFDPSLRRIDTASEVAFLAMDLTYRGRRDLADHFLWRYAAEIDDFGLFGVVDFYQSYRAAVRGKVAALAAMDPGIGREQRDAAHESAKRHLALAADRIAPRGRGALALVCGTVGVGKSTVAEALAKRTGGVVIASDRIRKQMVGLHPTAGRAAAPGEGLYRADRKDAVYAALLDRAEAVVASGRLAIVDATFDRRERRDRAREWAAAQASAAILVRVDCDADRARERLEIRAKRGQDASDAGPELLSTSRSRFEPPTEWPSSDRYEVRTDDGIAPGALDALAERLATPKG